MQVSQHFKDETKISQALNKIANSLQETIKYHSILIDQAGRSVSRSLNNFLKKYVLYLIVSAANTHFSLSRDLKQVKDSRLHFDKISADLDIALARHAQAPKNSNKNLASNSSSSNSGLSGASQPSSLQGLAVLSNVIYLI